MPTSLWLYIRFAVLAVTLMFSAVAVRAQSGISDASGVVADDTARKQERFVGVTGAKVELEETSKITRANSSLLPTSVASTLFKESHTVTIS